MTADRRPRQSREDLRALMLRAGRSILLEEGLGTGADALNFKRAFDRIESETGIKLSNASVIGRVWANLDDYQTDVLVELASDTSRSNVTEVADLVAAVLTERDLSTAEARSEALSEVCRVVGEALGDALRGSASWSVWINVWTMATSSDLPDRYQRVLSALMQSYDAINREGEEAFGSLMTLFGYRTRDPLTVAQFLNAVGALSEGCSLRDRVDSKMFGIVRPTGPDGEESAMDDIRHRTARPCHGVLRAGSQPLKGRVVGRDTAVSCRAGGWERWDPCDKGVGRSSSSAGRAQIRRSSSPAQLAVPGGEFAVHRNDLHPIVEHGRRLSDPASTGVYPVGQWGLRNRC